VSKRQQGVDTAGRAAVIGAGLGGLAAAVELRSRGWDVHVFEKQSGPGGKAFTNRLDGFRFDTGPSLLTLPEVFDELFALLGERREDHIAVTKLETLCRYFWQDGTHFRTRSDHEEMALAMHRTFGEDPAHLRSYLAYVARLYEIAGPVFLEHSLHEWETLASPVFRRSLRRIFGIDPFRTMDQANGAFFTSPYLRQLFNRYATYNGSSPYKTPATLNIIQHVEYNRGAYAVDEGIYSIPTALSALAERHGIRIHYGVAVEAIRSVDSRVTGIRVNGEEQGYDAVVSNADVLTTYDRLLGAPEAKAAKRYRRLEPSSSGFVFYWGMKRRFPELGLHNIFFSADYRREFDDIFERHIVPRDPTIYVNISSKVTSGDAPADGENWFVLINVPYHRDQNWTAEGKFLKSRVLRSLSNRLGVDVGAHIAVEDTLTPADIEAKTDSTGGSLYGIASNTRRAAFSRHPNRARAFPGLYFAGGSAHPGGGMPLAVLSGRLAGRLLDKYERGRRA
jgi:phytoene desaturase